MHQDILPIRANLMEKQINYKKIEFEEADRLRTFLEEQGVVFRESSCRALRHSHWEIYLDNEWGYFIVPLKNEIRGYFGGEKVYPKVEIYNESADSRLEKLLDSYFTKKE